MFCKKGVLRNFIKFTGKYLCLFIAGLRPSTLLKKRLWHRCFPVNFVKILRTPFYIEHAWTTSSVFLFLQALTGHTPHSCFCFQDFQTKNELLIASELE